MIKFGIFDQNDRGGLPLAQQYDERLKLAELYDESGFYCYHMSEHHGTSLSMAPSPSVFMSALTQRTKNLRLCPLVYLLPLYHPVRLAEEICMLDHLSKGRFQFGVGRGASPFELAALGVEPEHAAKMYAEALAVIRTYFKSDSLTHDGEFWKVKDFAVEVKPVQQPHPQIWYAVGSPDSVAWPAQNNINIVCGGPVSNLRSISDGYRAAWKKLDVAGRTEPLIGINRYVVVADTDEKAREIGRKAWPTFHKSFMKLWVKNNAQPNRMKLPPDFDSLLEGGQAVAGSPETVASALADQISRGGFNYFIGGFVFGSMPFADASASIRLFSGEVMPALEAIESVAA
jgi:alkanesulfonate monooxygenase SsuD/methylene tetrahydromethanopterin reductase-like flavin-dependent oxidoreductase (luciferase family)